MPIKIILVKTKPLPHPYEPRIVANCDECGKRISFATASPDAPPMVCARKQTQHAAILHHGCQSAYVARHGGDFVNARVFGFTPQMNAHPTKRFRTGRPWTAAEDVLLLQLHREGTQAPAIAAKMQRRTTGIRMRLNALAAVSRTPYQ